MHGLVSGAGERALENFLPLLYGCLGRESAAPCLIAHLLHGAGGLGLLGAGGKSHRHGDTGTDTQPPALATATSSKEPQLCKPLAVPSTRYKEKEIKPTMPQDAFDSAPGSCGEFRTFLCGGKTMGKASRASRGERGSAGEPAAQGPAAAEKH